MAGLLRARGFLGRHSFPFLPAGLAPALATRRIGIGLGALVLLASAACLPDFSAPALSSAATGPSARSAFQMGTVTRGDLTGVLTFSAALQAPAQVSVVPQVTAAVTALHVALGAHVQAGDPLADLDTSALQQQLTAAQAAQAAAQARDDQLKAASQPEALAVAQANLKAAQARLQAISDARTHVDPAALQQRVTDAQTRLSQLQSNQGASTQEVAQADSALSAAQTQLAQIQADPVRSKDAAALSQAQAAVQKAQATDTTAHAGASSSLDLELARLDLDEAQQEQAVDDLSFSALDQGEAQAMVDAAQAEVTLLQTPASPDEVQAADAAVTEMTALTQIAQNQLNAASITAPIDGIVTQVSAAVGATVGPTAPLFTLIPPQLQVDVQADQSQAGLLQTGQPASLAFASLPNDSFTGSIQAIAPALDPQNQTVAVQVSVDDPQGKLRPGMFAQVGISTGQEQNVLLVPKTAVVAQTPDADADADQTAGGAGLTFVYLVSDGRAHKQQVWLGASDGQNAEVLRGLNEGVDVLLNPLPTLIDGQSLS